MLLSGLEGCEPCVLTVSALDCTILMTHIVLSQWIVIFPLGIRRPRPQRVDSIEADFLVKELKSLL